MTALRRNDLETFFSAMARRLPSTVKLIVTGGGEAMLLGGREPTGDLDFSLVMSGRKAVLSSGVEAAIATAAQEVSVAVQYSSNIDGWSQVAIPEGKKENPLL
jgi:hypothetical protein